MHLNRTAGQQRPAVHAAGIVGQFAVLILALGSAAAGASGRLSAGEAPPDRITVAADLGLRRSDIPVSSETKIVYLVNPGLNDPQGLAARLRGESRSEPVPGGWSARAFGEDDIGLLTAPARPGDTAAYDAVSDIAQGFFKHMFSQVPATERNLLGVVQEVNRADFPLAAIDAVPRLLVGEGGKTRCIETLVTVRLFMVHLDGDRERNLRWVTRCELFFEDSAIGEACLGPGRDAVSALSASVLAALRGKIAASFTQAPELKRPSGRIDEPRRDLIDRSISTPVPSVTQASAVPGSGREPGSEAPEKAIGGTK